MRHKTLSNLELQVMIIIWEYKECTVRDVLTKLSKNREFAYSTVATLLRRLEAKKLLAKNSSSMTFMYYPKISKENYSKKLMASFIKDFLHTFGDTTIVSLADSINNLSNEKRDHFLKLLVKRSKNS